MKIRNGFVSNSSSSSYVVKIRDTTKKEFCDFIYAEKGIGYGYDYDTIIQKLDEDIKHNKQEIKAIMAEKEYPNSKWDVKKYMLKSQRRWLKEAVSTKNKVIKCGKNNRIRLTEIVLGRYGIAFDFDDNSVNLRYHTSMHNSFDDMGDLLREIVLAFMFDTKKKVECERTDHE
jgi:hypothetical protein